MISTSASRRRTSCTNVGMGKKRCEHGRERSRCKDCGGSGICEHGRRRTQCKECGGGSICEHGRMRSQCKECGGNNICEHGGRRYSCKECGGGGICEHGRHRGYCKESHGVVSYASTSMQDLVGYSCGVCKVRECVCQPGVDAGADSHGCRPARGRPGVGPH